MSKNSLLWKISSRDSSMISYLCGTMHVRDEMAFQYLDKVKLILPDIEQLFTEIDLSKTANEGLQDHFYLPAGRQLSDYLGYIKYNKYRAILLKSFGIEIERLRFYKPIIIANTIAESLMNLDHEATLDFTLYNLASEYKIPNYGLENIEEHYDILNKIPLPEQFRQLKSIAGNPSKYRYQLKRLLQAFETENLHQLYMLSKESLKEIKKIMLASRNEKMLNRIIEEMPHHKSLFAVGAAHLGGACGLVRNLKSNGFTLSPL